MLQSQDAQVRFFGALTFTIKINTDWDTLSAEDAAALLGRLLNWLLQLVQGPDSSFVIRKLCSALVAYFLRPSTTWDKCLRHLLCCFTASRVVGTEEISQFPPPSELLGNLSIVQFKATLWFLTMLVEEVGKTSSKSSQTHRYHDQLIRNVEDTVQLLHALLSKPYLDNELVKDAIKCFQAWVNYTHRSFVLDAPNKDLKSLNYLIPLLLQKLMVKDLFEDSVELFTEILVHFPAFLDYKDYTALLAILTSDTARGVRIFRAFPPLLRSPDEGARCVLGAVCSRYMSCYLTLTR